MTLGCRDYALRITAGCCRSATTAAHATLVCAVLLCGCDTGPEVYPVTGTVTLDGQPVEGAAVGLIPNVGGRHGSAVTDAKGEFVVGTFTPDDGALAGEHTVVVTKVKIVKPGNERAGIPPVLEYVVPERYDQPEASGLKTTVAKGTEPLELKLTTQGK